MKPIVAVMAVILLSGCTGQAMDDQARHEALEASDFFADGRAARPLPPGTVAQETPDHARPPLTAALLARGRQRFDVFCSPCHGRVGNGAGMIVQRGFPRPPSFHSQRLRTAPHQHLFDVMTHGYGVMYSYAARVPAPDRWAIAAYIRALQLSQHARTGDLPADMAPADLGGTAPES